jgi:hypothetical protein
VTSIVNDRGVTTKSLYDRLAVAVDPAPEFEAEPALPGTIHTAKIETVDNDQAVARLGGLAPL